MAISAAAVTNSRENCAASTVTNSVHNNGHSFGINGSDLDPSPVGNMFVQEAPQSTTDHSPGCSVLSTNKIPDSTHEIRQLRLEKKSSSLFTRIQKCQLHRAQSHIYDNLKSLVDCQQKEFTRRVTNMQISGDGSTSTTNVDNVVASTPTITNNNNGIAEAKKKLYQNLLTNNNWQEKLECLFRSGVFKTENFKCEELRRMSPSTLAKLLKKYSASRKLIDLLAKFNQNSSSSSSTLLSVLPSTSTAGPNGLTASTATCASSTLSVDEIQNLRDVSELLYSRLSDLQKSYDSEATDSSSGGESCDEEEIHVETLPSKLHMKKNRHLSFEERASYRWRSERASIGGQVAFVRTQMVDLEHKIRQHNELYRQLRARKLTDRYFGPNKSRQSISKPFSEHSARTMPVDGRVATRIVRTAGMFRWNRKTARLSNVHCGCFPPWPPCSMCGGRVNNIQNVPDICAQTRDERYCVLDHSYHPSLCELRGRDISLSAKLQGYWKQETVAVKSRATNVILAHLNSSSSTTPTKSGKKLDKNGYKLKNFGGDKQILTSHGLVRKDIISAMVAKKLSNTVKKRMMNGKVSSSTTKKSYKKSLKMMKPVKKWKKYVIDSGSSSGTSTPSSRFDGSLMSPNPGKLGAVGRRSTITQNTYDIDNIVIDPSVAAMTRVEKLPYKEIVTPGWREKEFEPLAVDLTNGSSVEMEEDTTEESFSVRHGKKEREEHAIFLTLKKV